MCTLVSCTENTFVCVTPRQLKAWSGPPCFSSRPGLLTFRQRACNLCNACFYMMRSSRNLTALCQKQIMIKKVVLCTNWCLCVDCVRGVHDRCYSWRVRGARRRPPPTEAPLVRQPPSYRRHPPSSSFAAVPPVPRSFPRWGCPEGCPGCCPGLSRGLSRGLSLGRPGVCPGGCPGLSRALSLAVSEELLGGVRRAGL